MNYPAASGRTVKRLRNENAPTKRGITPYRGLKKSLLVSLIIISALFLSVFAAGRGVTISEIAWAGSADDPTAEWRCWHHASWAARSIARERFGRG